MKLLTHAKQDVPAGIVVFFVALPLCLGIALASGAPLFSGLVAGIVGGTLVAAVSRSPLGVSGPAAGLAVIVFQGIQQLGGFPAFLLAVVLAGVIQIVLGVLRAGVLGYYFPSPVIKGMLTGIGVLIVMKQIPHALGHDSDPEGDLSFRQPDGDTTLSAFETMLGDLNASAIALSVTALVILLVWEKVLSPRSKIFRVLPGPLVAVAMGIGFQVWASDFAPDWALGKSHLVDVPVADGLGGLRDLLVYPDWSQLGNSAIYKLALTLAIVASLETLLCVEATDKLDPRQRVTPTSHELIAQGVGNVASGLVGGLPITQVIVRSSANIQSGGQSKLSAIVHGIVMIGFVVALPGVLNLIPLSVLAAILILVGYKLAKPSIFRTMFAQGFARFVAFLVTVVGIVFTDLLTGIALGMAVALLTLLKRSTDNSHFLEKPAKDAPKNPTIGIRLAEEITFLHRGAILKSLSKIPNGSRVRIDCSTCVSIDRDVIEVIEDFLKSAASRDLTVEVVGELSEFPTPPVVERVATATADPVRSSY